MPIENAQTLKKEIKNLLLYKEFEDLTHKDLLWNEAVVNMIKEVVSER